MDYRSLALCLSSATLAATTGVYGFKFVRKRNFLIGLEWWIVTISASNAVIFFATESPVSYFISHFLDAFSRGFGMPVIAVAGLMAVTHGYRPYRDDEGPGWKQLNRDVTERPAKGRTTGRAAGGAPRSMHEEAAR